MLLESPCVLSSGRSFPGMRYFLSLHMQDIRLPVSQQDPPGIPCGPFLCPLQCLYSEFWPWGLLRPHTSPLPVCISCSSCCSLEVSDSAHPVSSDIMFLNHHDPMSRSRCFLSSFIFLVAKGRRMNSNPTDLPGPQGQSSIHVIS